MVNGSIFWNQLVIINSLFQSCVTWEVRDGRTISYWCDAWAGAPIIPLKKAGPKPWLHSISLRDMISKWLIIVPVSYQLVPDFTEQEDSLLISTGKVRWNFSDLWQSYAPSKVKFFAFLWLHNKILTRDTMEKRGLYCAMCAGCPLETVFHLFFECWYAIKVWSHFGDLISISNSVTGSWVRSWQKFKRTTQLDKRIWATMFMGILWSIWKQRNEYIFRGRRIPRFFY